MTLYPTTNAVFSPDEKHIVTGCGSIVKGGKGRLLFLRRDDLEVAQELEMDSTPVKVVWHSKINQVRFSFFKVPVSVLYIVFSDCYFRSWRGLRMGKFLVFIHQKRH